MAQHAPELGEDFSEIGFVVLVEVPGGAFPRREAYVVACPTTEEAEAEIRKLYVDELTAALTRVLLPFGYTKALKLRSGEVLPWQ
jgi:hypothetical protein